MPYGLAPCFQKSRQNFGTSTLRSMIIDLTYANAYSTAKLIPHKFQIVFAQNGGCSPEEVIISFALATLTRFDKNVYESASNSKNGTVVQPARRSLLTQPSAMICI